jgi:hypothetical protein
LLSEGIAANSKLSSLLTVGNRASLVAKKHLLGHGDALPQAEQL